MGGLFKTISIFPLLVTLSKRIFFLILFFLSVFLRCTFLWQLLDIVAESPATSCLLVNLSKSFPQFCLSVILSKSCALLRFPLFLMQNVVAVPRLMCAGLFWLSLLGAAFLLLWAVPCKGSFIFRKCSRLFLLYFFHSIPPIFLFLTADIFFPCFPVIRVIILKIAHRPKNPLIVHPPL